MQGKAEPGRPAAGTAPGTGHGRFVHIAAGCIENERGEILVCQRPAHKIYPGEWEFPGGKLEAGESAEAALRRELHEELGIHVQQCRPLIRLRHRYPEIAVDLDVWKVTGFRGELRSREHPQVAWVSPARLPGWPLLAADRPIVNALRLPGIMVVTPDPLDPGRVAAVLARQGPALLRLRLPGAGPEHYSAVARKLGPVVRDAGCGLVVDRQPDLVEERVADAYHASAQAASRTTARPVGKASWFGVSCHDALELDRAVALDADYVVIGPVKETATHPGVVPLGWDRFSELALVAGRPAYAIGGLGPADLELAWRHRAQGIAGISAFF